MHNRYPGFQDSYLLFISLHRDITVPLFIQGTVIPHHQQTIPLHNTSTPQVSLHNATSIRKLLKMDVLTYETF